MVRKQGPFEIPDPRSTSLLSLAPTGSWKSRHNPPGTGSGPVRGSGSARESADLKSRRGAEYLALTRELTEPCPDRTLQRKGTQYFTPRFAKDESRRRGRLQTSETCAGLQVLEFKAFESPLHFSDRSPKTPELDDAIVRLRYHTLLILQMTFATNLCKIFEVKGAQPRPSAKLLLFSSVHGQVQL